MEEPTLEEVVEQRTEDATPPPPPATEGPSETVVEKVEEKAAAVEIINESIVREVTAPTPPACEQPDTTPAKEEPHVPKCTKKTSIVWEHSTTGHNTLAIDGGDIDEEKNSIEKPIVTSALDPDVSNGVRPIKIQTEKKRTALAIDGDDNDVEKRDTSSEMGTPIHNTTNKKKIMKMGDDNMTEELSNKCLFLRGLHSYFTLSCITSITQIIKALSSSNPALGISSPKSRHRPLSLSSVMGGTLLGDGVVDKHAMVATRVSSKWDSTLWFHANFPHLHLEDKVLLIGGGVDTGLVAHSTNQPSSDNHVQGAAGPSLLDNEPNKS